MTLRFLRFQLKGNSMNIHKHMEAVFVVTLVVVCAGTLVLDWVRDEGVGQTVAVVRGSTMGSGGGVVMASRRA